MMKARWSAGVGIGLLLAFAVSGVAIAATEPPENSRTPNVGVTEQLRSEGTLVQFLTENPRPDSGDFDQSVEGRNAYWAALASWWDRVPWDAVAGQWGCLSGAAGVTFNPPDVNGIISAGYGGVIDCGSAYDARIIPLLTEPVPRSEVNLNARN